jgi:hypothetical protein
MLSIRSPQNPRHVGRRSRGEKWHVSRRVIVSTLASKRVTSSRSVGCDQSCSLTSVTGSRTFRRGLGREATICRSLRISILCGAVTSTSNGTNHLHLSDSTLRNSDHSWPISYLRALCIGCWLHWTSRGSTASFDVPAESFRASGGEAGRCAAAVPARDAPRPAAHRSLSRYQRRGEPKGSPDNAGPCLGGTDTRYVRRPLSRRS